MKARSIGLALFVAAFTTLWGVSEAHAWRSAPNRSTTPATGRVVVPQTVYPVTPRIVPGRTMYYRLNPYYNPYYGRTYYHLNPSFNPYYGRTYSNPQVILRSTRPGYNPCWGRPYTTRP